MLWTCFIWETKGALFMNREECYLIIQVVVNRCPVSFDLTWVLKDDQLMFIETTQGSQDRRAPGPSVLHTCLSLPALTMTPSKALSRFHPGLSSLGLMLRHIAPLSTVTTTWSSSNSRLYCAPKAVIFFLLIFSFDYWDFFHIKNHEYKYL